MDALGGEALLTSEPAPRPVSDLDRYDTIATGGLMQSSNLRLDL